MDDISIISIIFVSFPEAIFIAMLGILSIGKFGFFNNRQNIYRLLLHSLISCIISYFLRRYVSSEIEALTISLVSVVLLFIFVLRLKFYESIFAAFFGFIILTVTEVIGLVSVSSITGITFDVVQKSDLLRILFTLPERIMHIVLICLSFKYRIRIVDFDAATYKQRDYYTRLFVYVLSIGTLIFLSTILARVILFNGNELENGILFRLNIYITVLVTVILTLATRSIHEFHVNKNILSNTEFVQSLSYILSLIDENKLGDAKESINSLKSHVSKL